MIPDKKPPKGLSSLSASTSRPSNEASPNGLQATAFKKLKEPRTIGEAYLMEALSDLEAVREEMLMAANRMEVTIRKSEDTLKAWSDLEARVSGKVAELIQERLARAIRDFNEKIEKNQSIIHIDNRQNNRFVESTGFNPSLEPVMDSTQGEIPSKPPKENTQFIPVWYSSIGFIIIQVLIALISGTVGGLIARGVF